MISVREGRFSLEDVFIGVVEKARQEGKVAVAGVNSETAHERRILAAEQRKELTQIVRDQMALGLALVLPLTQLILMGSAISLTVADLPIVVQDLDDSPASRSLIDAFRASNTFHIVPFPVDRQPETAFTSNVARAALIIPEHFGRDIARGVSSPVQMLIDASDSNTARLVSGYAAEVTARMECQ